ncbi:uncharacterized protein ACLA_024880 [Aspergillus clavatus NRRL 1]|uniref:Uncharacterized protein n=1 Tax=Aspergillus clavatus (strain ATCC 1007 / CBS 513.65 / DSM 816 / NCTC 3887 / NRRL 1 / QM 1276 / 107) TaxID=344612 RepID=A1CQ51_ASPCL|nr:uncharacterized protein ACLA_024880 [Aspergillus clavatus NRRL 1]EAW07772.1 hypothetical protein ACLA_024880 [Aspergillus clavatus NRRL 1]
MENYLPEYLHPLTQHPTLQTLTRLLPPSWAFAWPPTLTTIPSLAALRSDYLTPYLVNPLAALLSSSTPDLISVLLLLLILFVSLKILDYARRVVMFWVRVVVRVLFWGSVLGAAAPVVERPELEPGLARALTLTLTLTRAWLWYVRRAVVTASPLLTPIFRFKSQLISGSIPMTDASARCNVFRLFG